MNIRQYILVVVLIAALSFVCSCSEQPEKVKPNFVFILADDLGYSDLSCMGSLYYETPNIDAIAQTGMVFTNGYSGSQVCSPSRATILTGQFTARHGITDWIGAPEEKAWRTKNRNSKLIPASYNHNMSHSTLTLPQSLKRNGYTTFFAGKWHIGAEGFSPENHGFDINKGGFHRGSPANGFFAPFNNPKLEDHEPGENLSMRLAKETLNFIEQSKDEPFLAYLSFYAVHAPIQTSQDKWMKYRTKAEKMGIADDGFEDGHFLPMRMHQDNPVYAGLIESMDDAVGYVLQGLKRLGLDENTVIVFTSDNGGVISGDNYSTNCLPLKGGKGYQWEGGIRVPFIVNIPWLNHHGQRNSTPVISSDFYPTILDLADLPLHEEVHVDGKSLEPVLNGQMLNQRPLYWHYPHYGNQGGEPVSIIRLGDWKLIYYWEDGRSELYNLIKDIHEDYNMLEDQPELAKALRKQLLDWLKSVNAKTPQLDPLYNKKKEQQTIARMKSNSLEKQSVRRMQMLDPNWEPNSTWWGSTTVD